MFRQKWLAVAGAAALIASMVFSFSAVPSGAAGLTTVPQPAYNHARPPIEYFQVARPTGRGQPGRGPGGSSVVYVPANIQKAYDFGSLANGSGKTIAIVDAYGDPSLSSDVTAFDNMFGISPGNIVPHNVDGGPTSTDQNWAIETALDVEWAHANAPEATIDVIVVPDSSLQSLLDGVNYAISLDPAAISMSWGAPETSIGPSMLALYESAFSTATDRGIVLLGASGDQGAKDGTRTLTTDYPASSPEVIGVGGTSLSLNSSGGWGSETAWSSSGGGYSTISGEPGYQSTANIPDSTHMRGVPDVAFDANPNTGVYVYYNGSTYAVGGTSVGAPNWAAIVADSASAGNNLDSAYLYGTVYGVNGNSGVYSLDMHDITSGSNGGYYAATGWDAVTGLGSPDVSSLINAPSPSPDFSLGVSPTAQSVVQGLSATYTVTVNTVGGFGGTVDFTASGLPSGASATFSPTPSTNGSTLAVTTSSNTPTGSYTLVITGTSGSLVHSVNATLTVTSSSTATTVSVTSITYAASGGRNHNSNLSVTLILKDNLGNLVSNASVNITLDLNGIAYVSGTGTTGSTGSVTFTLSHAPSGTYTTVVNSITASGLTWDGITPSNSYP